MAAALALGACADSRRDDARAIGFSAGLAPHETKAGEFLITSFERAGAPGENADVYIEGDGVAWLDRATPSPDPTPADPLALRLATLDLTANVFYLARPCQYTGQYTGRAGEKPCAAEEWLGRRLAPEIVGAEGAMLEDLKRRYRITGFNLIGYSGGGGLAILLAAQRQDIISIRTVAANLDTDAFSDLHHVSPMTGSLNPASVADKVSVLPQLHFIGAEDQIIPYSIYNAFSLAAGPSPCVKAVVVPNATHVLGWVNAWPDLLRQALNCTNGS